jgi:HSP20 family protein
VGQQAGQTGRQGEWQGSQSSGQQSQYAGNAPSQYGRTNAPQQQGAGRGAQQSSRGVTSYGGNLFPDLYSGLGGGPFQLISRLSDEMERLFEGFGMGGMAPRSGQRGMTGQEGGQGLRQLWAPHIEVVERDGKLLIQADLPGVRKEDVSVQIEDDAVVIQGQRHQENTRNEQGFYHSERSYGSFYRMIPLPDGVNVDDAQASFRDGVLHIELPLQQRQRGRRLEIRDEAGDQGELGATPGAAATQGSQGSAHSTQGAGSGTTASGTSQKHTQAPPTMGQSGGAASPGGQQQAEGSSERR